VTRVLRGLDPFPTRAELEKLYRQRHGRDLPTSADFTHLSPTQLQAPAWNRVGRIEPGAIGERLSNGIRLTLPVAPRTKKNSTTLGIKQSPYYRSYRNRVIELVAGLKAYLGLPLAVAHYNIAAVYFVDRRGERADKVGLDQGLYDALQNAGVITDDWQFRTADGTRVVFGDAHPRVEITITQLQEQPDDADAR